MHQVTPQPLSRPCWAARHAVTTGTLSCWLQVNGHYMAKLDPLGLDKRPMPVELDPALYGFSDRDMDKE